MLVGPAAVILFAAAGPVVRILYGSQFAAAADSLRILAPATIFLGLGFVYGGALTSMGLEWAQMGITALALLLNLALNVLWIPAHAGVGAAYATMVSAVMYLILAHVAIGRGLDAAEMNLSSIPPPCGLHGRVSMRSATGEPEKPITFAILLASSAVGGEERFLAELAIAISRTSSQPLVLNLKTPCPYHEDMRASGVSVVAGLAPSRFDVIGLIASVRALRRAKPDVLLINSNRQAMWFGAVASRLCRLSVTLVHTHEHLGRTATTMRAMARMTRGIVAAADSHREYVHANLGIPLERIGRIYPGINFDRTASAHGPSTAASPVIGIVAALRPEKDHETFLRAAALVLKSHPEARFVVVGDGPRRPQLESLARALSLGSRVVFAGWQRVNAELLTQFQVLALSSRSETFPAVILEAFSAGVPVVATRVGSVPELLGSPPCGILVPPGDPVALAGALVSLLQAPPDRERLRAAAAERVKYFSADRFAADMLSLGRALAAADAEGIKPTLSQLLGQLPASGDHR